MKNKKSKSKRDLTFTKAYMTQAISQPDRREAKSGIALPDNENVKRNKDFVDENKK